MTLGGLGLFKFIRFLGKSTFPALLGGLSYALTPYGFGLINAGHTSKIMAMAFIPWVLKGAFHMIRKPPIKSVLFLSLVTACHLSTTHAADDLNCVAQAGRAINKKTHTQ